jgi:hypothetical protein
MLRGEGGGHHLGIFKKVIANFRATFFPPGGADATWRWHQARKSRFRGSLLASSLIEPLVLVGRCARARAARVGAPTHPPARTHTHTHTHTPRHALQHRTHTRN